MSSTQQPIGIFDSGIGGMTVARAIRERLPNESLVYFGDTAHLPYGDKSANAVKTYAKEITQFLLGKECKMIIVACNTASARGFGAVELLCANRIPAINVIDPVVEHVVQRYAGGTVGVIGTKSTVSSRVYPRRIQKADPSINVHSRATPLLAPMIEEGFFNNNISKAVIKSYLEVPAFQRIDALVLGCTHYPLIQAEVCSLMPPDVAVIDAAGVVADAVAQELDRVELRATGKPQHTFWVSDYTEAFHASTRMFFGERVSLQTSGIWGRF